MMETMTTSRTTDRRQRAYLSSKGQRGNITPAMIKDRTMIKYNLFDSVISNPKEANFPESVFVGTKV